MLKKALIMDKNELDRAVTRMAYEILERNKGTENLVFIGIQRRGVPLAKRTVKKIKEIENIQLPTGILDITLYRDDLSLLSEHPVLKGTDIPFSVSGKKIVLVDDVLFTGRTVRAAIEAIMDCGRPSCIQLMVMVDRGNRELPIRPDYKGKNVPTSKNEMIRVNLEEVDGTDEVEILDK